MAAYKKGGPSRVRFSPLLFNIFANDLHFWTTETNINTYANDHQLYFSHKCPKTIQNTITDDLERSLVWFPSNSLKANLNKFQRLGLAPGRPTIDMKVKVLNRTGTAADNKLNFHKQYLFLIYVAK